MIEVRGLSKYYGARKAIEDLNFSVSKGEVLGFLGPNGAGKSTTMKILTCFMPATAGMAKVAGYDVFDSPLEVKKTVGYLPETPPVYREMVVTDYLEYAAQLHGVKKPDLKKAVNTALEKCSLGHVRNRLIGNLSKGYKQRVGIAQAIVHNPQVLILDEPTVGLDPKQIIEIRDLIRSFAGEHTVILSTHILPEVQATCNRVLIINEGKIVAMDSLDNITARMKHGRALSILVRKGERVTETLKKINGVTSVSDSERNSEGTKRFTVTLSEGTDNRDAIAEALVQQGAGLLELRSESMSLEDIFVKLTTVENITESRAPEKTL